MKNILNYMLRKNGKYSHLRAWIKRKISLTMTYGKWKISSTMDKGKISSSICFLTYRRRGNGKYPQLWAQGKCKNILNYMLGKNGKYPQLYASSTMENILNYGHRTMENILNYGHGDNGRYPQLWSQGKCKNILIYVLRKNQKLKVLSSKMNQVEIRLIR
jgi:hypothetical protein